LDFDFFQKNFFTKKPMAIENVIKTNINCMTLYLNVSVGFVRPKLLDYLKND